MSGSGLVYRNGYAFERHGEKLNCTQRLVALKEVIGNKFDRRPDALRRRVTSGRVGEPVGA